MSHEAGAPLPPETTPEQLAALAAERPDLWDQIWYHPNCYDDLRQWMSEQHSTGQVATLQPSTPSTPSTSRTKRPVVAIIASVAAAALVLTGTAVALAMTNTWPFGVAGPFAALGTDATTVVDEDTVTFADGIAVSWQIDDETLGLGRATYGYSERMMPLSGVIEGPNYLDVQQIHGAVIARARVIDGDTHLLLLDAHSGEEIWSAAAARFSCDTDSDFKTAACLLVGAGSGEVVFLDATGQVGGFPLDDAFSSLRFDGDGLLLLNEQDHRRVRVSLDGKQMPLATSKSSHVVNSHYLVPDRELSDGGYSLMRDGAEVGHVSFYGYDTPCAAVLAGTRVLSFGQCDVKSERLPDGFTLEHLGSGGKYGGDYAGFVPGKNPVWLIPGNDLVAVDVQSGAELWRLDGSIPGWYQPPQLHRSADGEERLLLHVRDGYSLVDLRTGETIGLSNSSGEATNLEAVFAGGQVVVYEYAEGGALRSIRSVLVFDPITGELLAEHSGVSDLPIGEIVGGVNGFTVSMPFCENCSTADGASSHGGQVFVGPHDGTAGVASNSDTVATSDLEAVAAAAPGFLPVCPGETFLLAWMELQNGSIIVCGYYVDAPSYVAFMPNGEQQKLVSLGASDPGSDLAKGSVTWDASGQRYVATMATGAVLTLDYSIGIATLRDSESNAKVLDQQRFTRWVFVPVSRDQRSAADSAGAAGAFDVNAPSATAEDQVRYMVEVLEKAYEGRALVKEALPKLEGCKAKAGGYGDTIASMKAVRDNRAELLIALDAMPVDMIPKGPQLLKDLTDAIHLSYLANVEYVAWAEAANASGCAKLSKAGKTAAAESDAPKERFAKRWNKSVAPVFGVRKFDGWYI